MNTEPATEFIGFAFVLMAVLGIMYLIGLWLNKGDKNGHQK